jgi:hypothetical protein
VLWYWRLSASWYWRLLTLPTTTGKLSYYRRKKMKQKKFYRIIAIVMLLSFSTTAAFGEQPTTALSNSGNGETKFYSEGEVQGIVDELSTAAEDAIERAAGEAAKAAVLASLEREAAAITLAQGWQGEYLAAKRKGVKTAVITGVICFFGGLASGGLITRIPAG